LCRFRVKHRLNAGLGSLGIVAMLRLMLLSPGKPFSPTPKRPTRGRRREGKRKLPTCPYSILLPHRGRDDETEVRERRGGEILKILAKISKRADSFSTRQAEKKTGGKETSGFWSGDNPIAGRKPKKEAIKKRKRGASRQSFPRGHLSIIQ